MSVNTMITNFLAERELTHWDTDERPKFKEKI